MLDHCNYIDSDTNILISHGPPSGILDDTFHGNSAGCQAMMQRIYNLEHLKAHIFGHIHECFGQEEHNGVKFVNASICTFSYQPTNKPIVIEV